MTLDAWEAIWNQRSRYADFLSEQLGKLHPKLLAAIKARTQDDTVAKVYGELQQRQDENFRRMRKLRAKLMH